MCFLCSVCSVLLQCMCRICKHTHWDVFFLFGASPSIPHVLDMEICVQRIPFVLLPTEHKKHAPIHMFFVFSTSPSILHLPNTENMPIGAVFLVWCVTSHPLPAEYKKKPIGLLFSCLAPLPLSPTHRTCKSCPWWHVLHVRHVPIHPHVPSTTNMPLGAYFLCLAHPYSSPMCRAQKHTILVAFFVFGSCASHVSCLLLPLPFLLLLYVVIFILGIFPF